MDFQCFPCIQLIHGIDCCRMDVSNHNLTETRKFSLKPVGKTSRIGQKMKWNLIKWNQNHQNDAHSSPNPTDNQIVVCVKNRGKNCTIWLSLRIGQLCFPNYWFITQLMSHTPYCSHIAAQLVIERIESHINHARTFCFKFSSIASIQMFRTMIKIVVGCKNSFSD